MGVQFLLLAPISINSEGGMPMSSYSNYRIKLEEEFPGGIFPTSSAIARGVANAGGQIFAPSMRVSLPDEPITWKHHEPSPMPMPAAEMKIEKMALLDYDDIKAEDLEEAQEHVRRGFLRHILDLFL
jgi:hypothetical protein